MTFTNGAWHVRLIRWTYGGHTPNSLCPYFWALVASMLLLPTTLVVRVFAMGLRPVAVYVDRGAKWDSEQGEYRDVPSEMSATRMSRLLATVTLVLFSVVFAMSFLPWQQPVVGLILAIGLVGIFLLFFLGTMLEGIFLNKSKPKKQKKPRDPSVVMAFIRAKKRKVCPIITIQAIQEGDDDITGS